MRFTTQQQAAIDRRDGDLLLDAGAGSGKTRVLAERFALAVEEDGIAVGELLTITFTDKAAAELRQRIRTRLAQGPQPHTARETESAWISTIHGFCARVLRAHALSAGIDPQFTVLDAADADALARGAFNRAVARSARSTAGAALIAAHRPDALREAVRSTYEELRSRGITSPRLPPLPEQAEPAAAAAAAAAAAQRVRETAAAAARELGTVTAPGKTIVAALAMLESVDALLDSRPTWPADLDPLKLDRGANALKAPVCDEFREAVDDLRNKLGTINVAPAHSALNELLTAFGDEYRELKRQRSALDFEDLQLVALELLRRPEIGGAYRERFKRVMVDEAQDTNRVQFELIAAIANDNVFMVGDAQQSIYAFRHADVELFRRRGRELDRGGAHLQLTSNFRSVPEIRRTINLAFAAELGEDYRALERGGGAQDGGAPPGGELVELITVSKAIEREHEGAASGWRAAEAKALAVRIAQLIAAGVHRAGEVVVLTRASTDVQIYERAIARHGIATYVVGGGGYWEQPQVNELVSYLKALCNHADSDARHAALISGLCGLSLEGLVLYAAGAQAALGAEDARRLRAFEELYERQRLLIAEVGAEQLLHDAIQASGYDLTVAALAGGRRRLAAVRKLLRLARDHEAAHGPDLRGFLDLVELRASGRMREPEAPLAGEGIDAVRLMTIHASKGLEFPVVCVADLGRERPANVGPMVRIGADNSTLGLLIRRAGEPLQIRTLAYDALVAENYDRDLAEERRLFYVAMTRAQRRLILSGAAHLEDPAKDWSAPIGWIRPAIKDLPDVRSQEIVELEQLGAAVAEDLMVRAAGAAPESEPTHEPESAPESESESEHAHDHAHEPQPRRSLAHTPPVASLSYSALSTYEHCHLRFYATNVLGLPPSGDSPATARGREIHALLAEAELGAAVLAPELPVELAEQLRATLASETLARIRAAPVVRREQQFAFQAGKLLITGVFDVLTASRSGAALEVIDYKSDALHGKTPQQLTVERYGAQRLIYALAALGTGAREVTVTYLYLEQPHAAVCERLTCEDRPRLEAQLVKAVEPLLARDFSVTETPGRFTCAGCPARTTLCPHPYEATLA